MNTDADEQDLIKLLKTGHPGCYTRAGIAESFERLQADDAELRGQQCKGNLP